jgi:hypothetical protein
MEIENKAKPEELFQTELAPFSSYEEKIQFLINKMKEALQTDKNPDFKVFWDAKKMCLLLFKEPINSQARTKFWQEYIELADQAKALKKILEEQLSFSFEQLNLAIVSLETDLNQIPELIEKMHHPELPPIFDLKNSMDYYRTPQKELNFLNFYASKIHALRKELIRTDIKIKEKNRLFKTLSLLGDKIFPRRKELIKEVSEHFEQDVLAFIDKHFVRKEEQTPYFILRKEIKLWQNMAKILTLNTKSFTTTRLELSRCWDQIKELDQVKKKEMDEKKKVFEENFVKAEEKVKEMEACAFESLDEAKKVLSEAEIFINGLEIRKQDHSMLFDRLYAIQIALKEKQKEKQKIKKQQFELFKKEIRKLTLEKMEKSLLQTKIQEMEKTIQDAHLKEEDVSVLMSLMKPLYDRLVDRDPTQEKSIQELEELLNQRKSTRDEIKSQVEQYRKALGGSSIDFEKGILYREMLDVEKTRLDQIQEMIEKLEEEIFRLKE